MLFKNENGPHTHRKCVLINNKLNGINLNKFLSFPCTACAKVNTKLFSVPTSSQSHHVSQTGLLRFVQIGDQLIARRVGARHVKHRFETAIVERRRGDRRRTRFAVAAGIGGEMPRDVAEEGTSEGHAVETGDQIRRARCRARRKELEREKAFLLLHFAAYFVDDFRSVLVMTPGAMVRRRRRRRAVVLVVALVVDRSLHVADAHVWENR